MVAAGRDVTLDLIRGLCLVSMTLAHLAPGSVPDRVVKAGTTSLFDGASGFFLISGIVLGLVHQRRAATVPLRTVEEASLRRAGLLYVAHVVPLVIALLVAQQVATAAAWTDVARYGGWDGALTAAATLQLNPQYFGILSVYIVLMLLVAALLPLFRAERLWTVAAIVAGVYVAAWLAPVPFTLPEAPGVRGFWSWGGWQALFFVGMLLGWRWERWELRRWLTDRRTVAVVALVTGALIAFARLLVMDVPVTPGGVVEEELRFALYGKGAMGPLRILVSLGGVALLYAVVQFVTDRGWFAGVRRAVARIGRKALDAFVISRFAIVALPFLPFSGRSGWIAAGYALLTLVVSWAWAGFREGQARTRRERAAATTPTTTAVTGRRDGRSD
ncbi:OpgC domain-containing protein [Egicoccus halophilus]|uniref:Uncharacterized protein n=1 Tax=Egicoccus halophilus TaxID=1670830 RepID=A0A8J3A7G4_9ACTN|nr:OpgC domain-containing protein [Egicoccus halophilus]GGI05548.1 hypothetical protein GCM10011354_14650 [Egicoccus halophilus]